MLRIKEKLAPLTSLPLSLSLFYLQPLCQQFPLSTFSPIYSWAQLFFLSVSPSLSLSLLLSLPSHALIMDRLQLALKNTWGGILGRTRVLSWCPHSQKNSCAGLTQCHALTVLLGGLNMCPKSTPSACTTLTTYTHSLAQTHT